MNSGILLVHGGQHAGDCWDPTVAALSEIAPDVRVVAVDLPGRRGVPGDLGALTVADCVTSVVAQIDEAGLERVLLVGHSLAGITLPGVAEKLGARRLAGAVFVACCVPPEGKAVVDTLAGPLRFFALRAARRGGVAPPIPGPVARWAFGVGRWTVGSSREAQRRPKLYPESSRIIVEPVHRNMPATRLTWVLTQRDRALAPTRQRDFIDSLGGVDRVVELDTGHNAMQSAPHDLAQILADCLSDHVGGEDSDTP